MTFAEACAFIGAGLGIYNALRSYISDKERIRVQQGTLDNGSPALVVTNRSSFAISITEVGGARGESHLPLSLDRILSPYALPMRLEPRSSYRFPLSMMDAVRSAVNATDYYYAITGVGSIFTTEPWPTGLWRKLRQRLRRPLGS